MDLINYVLLIASIVFFAYCYVTRRYRYWAERGAVFSEPVFPYGCLSQVGKKIHLSDMLTENYKNFKGKGLFTGLYFFVSPVILLLDIDLIKTVLVKDFNYFMNRGIYFNERDDPLSAHLISLEDAKWKNLRTKLNPTFSSAKLRKMFPVITAVANEFKKCLEKSIAIDSEIEMTDIMARFSTDVIGTCAYGIDCNSLKDPNAVFRQMGKKMFAPTRFQAISRFFTLTSKEFSRFLRIKVIDPEVSAFFMNVVTETIEHREKEKVQRNDFMNLLIQLKNKGKLDEEDEEGHDEYNGDEKSVGVVSLTETEIAAQAFAFFSAGFETISMTMSYALYELSIHQEIQDKAREEILQVIDKHNGTLSYEALGDLKYLEQILNGEFKAFKSLYLVIIKYFFFFIAYTEALRRYPPFSNIIRKVSKNYKVPGTNFIFEKDLTVIIPAIGIHHDPEFYPDPEKFDPDRFTEENVQKRNPYTFLPFGQGPRACIGVRFAIMEAKIALANLIQNYKFTLCSKSVVPLTISLQNFILTPKNGLWVNVAKIDN